MACLRGNRRSAVCIHGVRWQAERVGGELLLHREGKGSLHYDSQAQGSSHKNKDQDDIPAAGASSAVETAVINVDRFMFWQEIY